MEYKTVGREAWRPGSPLRLQEALLLMLASIAFSRMQGKIQQRRLHRQLRQMFDEAAQYKPQRPITVPTWTQRPISREDAELIVAILRAKQEAGGRWGLSSRCKPDTAPNTRSLSEHSPVI
jgi:hypothetical protein